jgi:hypothetical protein
MCMGTVPAGHPDRIRRLPHVVAGELPHFAEDTPASLLCWPRGAQPYRHVPWPGTVYGGRLRLSRPGTDAGRTTQEPSMPVSLPAARRDVTTLNALQREWIRREGRIARAIEAAQRRSSRRFGRTAAAPPARRPRQRVNSP